MSNLDGLLPESVFGKRKSPVNTSYFLNGKVKVNLTFDFAQDLIFTNPLLQIDCGVKELVLNL